MTKLGAVMIQTEANAKIHSGTPRNRFFITQKLVDMSGKHTEIHGFAEATHAVQKHHIDGLKEQAYVEVEDDKGLAYRLKLNAARHVRNIVEAINSDHEVSTLLGKPLRCPNLERQLCPDGVEEFSSLPYIEQQVENAQFIGQVEVPEVNSYLEKLGLGNEIVALEDTNSALRDAIFELAAGSDSTNIANELNAKEAYERLCTIIYGLAAVGDIEAEDMYTTILEMSKLRALHRKLSVRGRTRVVPTGTPITSQPSAV
jgi:hypothetical protein